MTEKDDLTRLDDIEEFVHEQEEPEQGELEEGGEGGEEGTEEEGEAIFDSELSQISEVDVEQEDGPPDFDVNDESLLEEGQGEGQGEVEVEEEEEGQDLAHDDDLESLVAHNAQNTQEQADQEREQRRTK